MKIKIVNLFFLTAILFFISSRLVLAGDFSITSLVRTGIPGGQCNNAGSIPGGIITYDIGATNNTSSNYKIIYFAFHSNTAGCTPYDQFIGNGFNKISGIDFYNPGQSGTLGLQYDVGTYDCGRTQIDAGYYNSDASVPSAIVFIGEVINYGIDCILSSPTPTPTISPPSVTPSPSIDITPPKISNVRITNITQNGATVTWTTDELSDSQVEYCLTASSCGIKTSLNTSLVTNHSTNLSELTPDTYYYVWVKSRDGAGNLGVLGYYLFRTLSTVVVTPTPTPTPTRPPTPTPSVIPLVISNIQVANITRDSAIVTWETDRPADGRVINCLVFILCPSLGYDATLTTSHVLNIANLRADKSYSIQVVSQDSNGIRDRSDRFFFKTEPGLVISDVQIINITQTSITVSWKTNYPADSLLKVCILPFLCLGGATYDSTIMSTHLITVTGLRRGTRYGYGVRSVDVFGYKASSKNVYFNTLP